ncbi:MAG: YtxH domain-containing protein [Chloroflexota bacterium]
MKALRFFEGFVIGGLVGVAIATLFAPSSGEDLRGRLQGEAERVKFEVNRAATQRRSELEQQLAALRAPR